MERPLCMNEKDILKQKKMIVSRQPIFSNLKSNTMKNIAKILILRHIAKFLRVFLVLLLPKRSIF